MHYSLVSYLTIVSGVFICLKKHLFNNSKCKIGFCKLKNNTHKITKILTNLIVVCTLSAFV